MEPFLQGADGPPDGNHCGGEQLNRWNRELALKYQDHPRVKLILEEQPRGKVMPCEPA